MLLALKHEPRDDTASQKPKIVRIKGERGGQEHGMFQDLYRERDGQMGKKARRDGVQWEARRKIYRGGCGGRDVAIY